MWNSQACSVKCPSCGFSRSGQGLDTVKCSYCESNAPSGRLKSHIENGCPKSLNFAKRERAERIKIHEVNLKWEKFEKGRAKRKKSLLMLKESGNLFA